MSRSTPATPRRAVVLGAGPAGLAATLALVRAGIPASLVEAAPTVGGLCVTTRDDGFAFDLGGHILFVHDPLREAWLRELLGPDLVWVDRPVASIVDGGIRRGRYYEQAGPLAATPPPPPPPTASARDYLASVFPADPAALGDVIAYMQKVDGATVDDITAMRCHKLFAEQYAPDGWWYPAGGIGQLMDAMARAIVAGGGEVLISHRVERIVTTAGAVTGVAVRDPSGATTTLETPAVIAGLVAGVVLRLLGHDPPTGLPTRAAAVVALALDTPRLTDEPWIQVNDPAVPFSRLSEPKNWSARLAPHGRTVVTGEVYCTPDDADAWWSRDDADLSAHCRDGLVHLGLLSPATRVEPLRVLRRPHAWSVVTTDRVHDVAASLERLAAVEGLVMAQGGDVVQAIDAGEQAAYRMMSALDR